MTKDLIGRALGVLIALTLSFLFIAFVKWNLNVWTWGQWDRMTILLLPLMLYGIGNARELLRR